MTVLLLVLSRIWPYLLGAALLTGGWLYADRVCWSTACRQYRASADTLRAEKAAAQERATAMALLWAKAIDNVEVRYVEVARDRENAASGLRERARSIGLGTRGASIRLPPDAISLLGDIASFANDSAPAAVDQKPPEAVSQPARDTSLADWLTFAADAADAYRDARDKHLACVAAYESLREDRNGQAQ